MNSLSYLSRQLDVYANPRTPPSTPTADTPRTNAPPKPTSSWSSSILFSPPTSTFVSPKLSTQPSADSPVHSKYRLRIRPLLRRLFFVRVFVLLWNSLCATWASLPVAISLRDSPLPSIPDRPRSNDIVQIKQEPPPDSPLLSHPPPIPPPPSSTPLSIIHRINHSHSFHPPPLSSHQSSLPSSTLLDSASRSSTPVLTTHRTPFHAPKTLVLDLDETLIHSTSKPILSYASAGSGLLGFTSFGSRNKGTTVQVFLGGRSTLYHVYKRPFVDYFLRKVSAWYTLVIFTASMQEYADPVIDWLDAGRGILARRFFRESCTLLPNGSYTKDLSIVEQDLSRVCLVDNSPICYRINEDNGIPIEGWTHDPSDEALLDLLPILDSLRFTNDVRRVLGIRGFL